MGRGVNYNKKGFIQIKEINFERIKYLYNIKKEELL